MSYAFLDKARFVTRAMEIGREAARRVLVAVPKVSRRRLEPRTLGRPSEAEGVCGRLDARENGTGAALDVRGPKPSRAGRVQHK